MNKDLAKRIKEAEAAFKKADGEWGILHRTVDHSTVSGKAAIGAALDKYEQAEADLDAAYDEAGLDTTAGEQEDDE